VFHLFKAAGDRRHSKLDYWLSDSGIRILSFDGQVSPHQLGEADATGFVDHESEFLTSDA